MQEHHYRDLIVRAVHERDGRTLDKLIAQLVDAERTREILRAKGYGAIGMTAGATAALVPESVVDGTAKVRLTVRTNDAWSEG